MTVTRTFLTFVTVGAGSGVAVTVTVAVSVTVTVGPGFVFAATVRTSSGCSPVAPIPIPSRNNTPAAGSTTRFRAHRGPPVEGGCGVKSPPWPQPG